MLNFFRKTRKKMANDKKALKYMKYAIGEIVLVVVGILIALQINTWSKEHTDKKKEVFYLSGIREDLKQDTLALDNSIKFESMILTTSKRILSTFNRNDSFIMNDSVIRDLNVLMASSIPNTHTTNFEELNSTGQIGLISIDSLRNHIINYYQKQESLNESFKSNISGVFQRIVLPVIQSYSLFNVESLHNSSLIKNSENLPMYPPSKRLLENINKIWKDPEIEIRMLNAINLRLGISIVHYERMERKKQEAKELLHSIQKRLDDN